TLGLPARGSEAPLSGTLYAYSPYLLPIPRDWGADVAVTGFWFLDSLEWQPDRALAAFLANGPPPIHVGFGSMPGLAAEEMTALIVDGLAKAGKRGVLSTGGGALVPVDGASHVHFMAGAPHDRLFPLMSATLHHGGAGT